MNEFNQEQSTITHEKLEELRTLCNMLCDKTIKLVEAAESVRRMEVETIKKQTTEKAKSLMVNKDFVMGMKYVFSMLSKLVGISFLKIDPVFVNVNTFSEFKEKELNSFFRTAAGKELLHIEEKFLKILSDCMEFYKKITKSVKELKEKINKDNKYLLLCYKGLLKAYNQPAESYEDLIMLHIAMTECGIKPEYTIKEIVEKMSTEKIQVRKFIEANMLKFEKDESLKEKLDNPTITM